MQFSFYLITKQTNKQQTRDRAIHIRFVSLVGCLFLKETTRLFFPSEFLFKLSIILSPCHFNPPFPMLINLFVHLLAYSFIQVHFKVGNSCSVAEESETNVENGVKLKPWQALKKSCYTGWDKKQLAS